MTLFIAFLLIWGFDLSPPLYGVAIILWMIHADAHKAN
jgi:hypothetical protein